MDCGNKLAIKLDRHRKQHLVNRYILEAVDNEYIVPRELLKLCSKFYDETLYWTVSKCFMEKHFYSLKNGCGIIGPSFKCDNQIEYQIIIYPKGSQPQYDNYCECFFRIKSKSFKALHINEIMTYFEIGCIETNTEYRNVGKFTVKESWSNWYPFNMKSSEIKQFDSLTFTLYVDILRVRYSQLDLIEVVDNDHNQIHVAKEYNKQIRMSPRLTFKWNIEQKLWKKLTFYEDNKRFYSPNYFEDDCWTLYCTPNTNRLYFQLYLRLIRLPAKVKSIKVRCFLSTNVNPKRVFMSLSRLNYNQNSIKLCTMKPSQLLTVNDLSINLKIQICQIYDYEDNRIKAKHWPSYGVMSAAKALAAANPNNAKVKQWKNRFVSQSKTIWQKMRKNEMNHIHQISR